jgi:hypothetical protein
MTSIRALFGRLAWMILGPFILAVSAVSILRQHDGWFSPLDLVYLGALGGMLLGRWLEFRYGRPLTAMGEPATAADLRRYALALGTVGLGTWVAANLIGNRAMTIVG